jgi:hypothetical protein
MEGKYRINKNTIKIRLNATNENQESMDRGKT